MQTLSKVAVGVLVAAALLTPLVTFAIGIPFGGVVDGETPCHVGPIPMLWINVLGFDFVEAPGTIPFLYYVPIVGQFILGMADGPITCFVGTVPLPPGIRIQLFGTSGAPIPI